MSNPFQNQRSPYQHLNPHIGASPDMRDLTVQPSKSTSSTGSRSHSTFKRPRDDYPPEHSWQKSFKRLKVMEEDDDNRFTSDAGGYLNSNSIVEAASITSSCPSETPDGVNAQSTRFVTQYRHEHQGYGIHHLGLCQQSHHESLPTTQHIGDAALVPESQIPGQGSSENNRIDYQPMNSLLGSLHRTRRRLLSGAGQETETSSYAEHKSYGGNMLSQMQSPTQQSHTHPLPSQSHHLETGGTTSYFRPAKKKSISLLVDSNLY
jgi:hypothetical protein